MSKTILHQTNNNMETKLTSDQFSLSSSDWLKGLIMAIGTPILLAIQEMIPNWHIGTPGSGTDILIKAAISATVTYLLKNFFDKPKVVIEDQKTVQAVKDGAIVSVD